MPFERPSPSEIMQRLQAEMDAALPGADARLRHSVENVLARMITMSAHEMHGFLQWMARQIHPATADMEFLEFRHAELRGITRKPATTASGEVILTGVNGTIVEAGSIFKRADDAEYVLDADVTIAGGTGTGTVTASEAGADGNAVAESKLTLTSPVGGVQSVGLVGVDGLTGGNDIEDDDSLRARVIRRWQQPPQGGAKHDYVDWALEVPGVTRAWSYPLQLGDGTVQLIFVMDNKEDTIIPTAPEVATVQDYIDEKRPATADVFVSAPTPVALDFEVHLNPNTAAIQAAVTAELQDFIRREAEPGGELFLSRISEAISAASGEFAHVLVSPAANVVTAFGEISVLGDITFEAL